MDDFILEKIATQYCGTLGGVTGQLNHSDKGDDWPSTSNLLTLNLPLQMIVQEAPIQAWCSRAFLHCLRAACLELQQMLCGPSI